MTTISRRRLLAGIAASSLPVAPPVAAEGMDDLTTVRTLIDAHRAASSAFDDSPGEIWENYSEEAQAIGIELARTGEALCLYRPRTLEGVHRKAEYMMSCDSFVDGEHGADSDFTPAELIRGFLPAIPQAT